MRSEHLALLAQHSRSGNITDYYTSSGRTKATAYAIELHPRSSEAWQQ